MTRREETAAWGGRHGVQAGITDRTIGSLGFWTAEPVGDVMGRWREFRRARAPSFPGIVMAHQVHGTAVLWHEAVGPGWHLSDGADGHATAQHGLLLAVTVADCVPVYMAARGRAVALLHAGWRGVAAGMLPAGIAALDERAEIEPGELALHLGVAICGKCYEVGPEVLEAVTGERAASAARLDLRERLAAQAEALGIQDITTSPYCTSCDHDRFYSHRASRGDASRLIAWLGLPRAV